MGPESDDDSLPLFPLGNVVLFPGLRVPLYVFEPRYRQMTRAVLDGDRRIGMVAIRPEHLEESADDPPVFSVGCEGIVSESARNPDGTYNVVVQGTHRFRILDEPPRPSSRLYRVARVERLEDAPAEPGSPRVAALRREVFRQVRELVRRTTPAKAASFKADLFEGIDDTTFVNALCHSLDFDSAEKQGLLEATGTLERFERLAGLLSFRLVLERAGAASDPDVLH
jgi:Lon protease-like protein